MYMRMGRRKRSHKSKLPIQWEAWWICVKNMDIFIIKFEEMRKCCKCNMYCETKPLTDGIRCKKYNTERKHLIEM